MGSRFRNLFFGKTSTGNNDNLRSEKGSYESAVALEPPVKGSYPVAGNGPNVLDEIQRSRAKKDARSNGWKLSYINTFNPTTAPSDQRARSGTIERPQTAPHNGGLIGGHNGTNNTGGRTRSGFSMKAPPNFFSSNRRDSIRSTKSQTKTLPPLPGSTNATREVQTYQPKKGPISTPRTPNVPLPREYLSRENSFIPPFAQHQRTSSRASHKSHVDLLDAQSNIRSGRETSQNRAKASGVRNYGEDVADRNIADHGDRDVQNLDLNSPDFSYLKSLYVHKKRHGGLDGAHSRAGSALGHVLGGNNSLIGSDGSGDDTTYASLPHTKGPASVSAPSPPIRSFTASRPATTTQVHPSRYDPSTSRPNGVTAGRHDENVYVTERHAYDGRGRAVSSFSSTTSPIFEEPPARDPRRRTVISSRSSSIPSRSRPVDLNLPTVPAPLHIPQKPSLSAQVSPEVTGPVEPPPRISSHGKTPSSTSTSKRRQRAMSSSSQHVRGSRSRNSSVSYSAFPNTTPRNSAVRDQAQDAVLRTIPNSGDRRPDLIVEGAKEPPSLEGIVNLTNTVDTDVVTRTAPAVVHETVKPTRHEIREEKITREIHTHDVYHRILPIIETEVLPTKHYVQAPDGKSLVEISEDQIPGRTKIGSPNRNWKIVDTALGHGDHGASLHRQDSFGADGAEAPVVGLARGEPGTHQSRGNSASSMHNSRSKIGSRGKNILEPILSSKKETVTREGVPRTEYVWRHPPTFENANGVNQGPVYIGAGLGDLSTRDDLYYSDDEDIEGAEFGTMQNSMRAEDLLFRDSGYGSPGGLPGIQDPIILDKSYPTKDDNSRKAYGDVHNSESKIGQATRALKRLKEKRHGRASIDGSDSASADVSEVERGIRGLNV